MSNVAVEKSLQTSDKWFVDHGGLPWYPWQHLLAENITQDHYSTNFQGYSKFQMKDDIFNNGRIHKETKSYVLYK